MEVKDIPLEQIHGTAFTVRADPDEVSQELLGSIKEHGIKQPILLRRKENFYEVVAGARRFAACQKLGLQTIPSILEDLDDKTAFELALTENLQRKTLAPLEEARAFLNYVDEYHWGSITELAKRVGKQPSYIVDRIKLLELPPKLSKEIFSARKFSVSHAEELLRLGNHEDMEELAEAIKEHGLTSDATADVVKLVKEHAIPVERAVETVQATDKLRGRAQLISEQARQSLIEAEPHKAKRIIEIADEGLRSVAKRLELFPERSQKMEPKFEQLAMWEERGIIPYTMWDFAYRDDYAGDKDFHGNCSPQVVEQCIWRLTEERDLVVDPMAGSGTALDVCKRFNRRCVAYDINPARSDIEGRDSRNMPLDSDTVDMIFIHPPYWNLVRYTTNDDRESGDLSRVPSLQAYLQMLGEVFTECRRILKPGKHMCVLIGDLVRDGEFIPLCRKVSNLAEELNFIDRGYAVKLAHGEVSRKKSGVIVAELAYTNNLKISHDLVLFLRKGES